MKLLVDACLSYRLADGLRGAGHDAEWVGSLENPPSDAEALDLAWQAQRIVVTLDKDFGELVVVGQWPNPGIIRLVDFALKDPLDMRLRVLGRYGAELSSGALLTVSAGRVRIREPQ